MGIVSTDRRRVMGFAVVGLVGLMLGGVLWGNLFTLVTGEFPGPGPGFGQQMTLSVDTETKITTSSPERFVTGPFSSVPQLVVWYWSATGQMVQGDDGLYTIAWSRHAGVLTNDGADWVEDQLSDSPSAATIAKWIALTRDAHVPAAADERLWAEIDTAGGLDKAEGAYASTGVGVWTVFKQFTADTDYVDVQATGLHWTTTGSENNTMLCADTFAPVTLASGDKISITWTITLS